MKSANRSVGVLLKAGDIVVHESTVYPGATEEVYIPILEWISELAFDWDFFVGYSPECINPSDKAHRLTTIKKVTSDFTPEAADVIDVLCHSITPAGTHKPAAPGPSRRPRSSRIPSTTSTSPLSTSSPSFSTAWGSQYPGDAGGGGQQVELPTLPTGGLVGGHCIGVDPYIFSPTRRRPSVIIRRSSSPAAPPQRPTWAPLLGTLITGRVIKLMTPAQPGNQGQSGAGTRPGVQGKLPGSA